MLIYDRQSYTWFSRLLLHPASKLNGSILTTPESARGSLLAEAVLSPVQTLQYKETADPERSNALPFCGRCC